MSWEHVVVAAQLLTPIVVGFIGYLLKRTIADIDRRQTLAEERLQKLEANTAAKERLDKLEDGSASKEEFLRETGRVAQRLDQIMERLAQHEGQDHAIRELAIAIATHMRGEHREQQ